MARRGSNIPGIARIDQPEKHTHGWYVRVRVKNKVVSKYFADKQFGGKTKALAQAIRFRDKLLKGKPPPKARKKAKSTSTKRRKPKQRSVVLAPDVAAAFPDAAAVNQALRQLMKVARTMAGELSKKSKAKGVEG